MIPNLLSPSGIKASGYSLSGAPTTTTAPLSSGSLTLGTRATFPALATPTTNNTLASQFKAPSTQQPQPLSFSLGGNSGSIVPTSTATSASTASTAPGALQAPSSSYNLPSPNLGYSVNGTSTVGFPGGAGNFGQTPAPVTPQYNAASNSSAPQLPANPNYSFNSNVGGSTLSPLAQQLLGMGTQSPQTPQGGAGGQPFTQNPSSINPSALGIYQQLLAQSGAYGNMINSVLGQAQNNPAEIGQLRTNLATALGNEAMADPSAISFKTGTQAQLLEQEAAKEAALQAPLSAVAPFAQAQQGLLTSALGSIPTGLQYGALGGGSGNFNPQSVASQLAQLVNSGQMSYQDASNQLDSLYGAAGSTFLQQAMYGTPGNTGGTGGVNPSFNTVQAAQNQGAQGQLGPQSTQASLDFSNLNSTLSQAPWYQQSGIPVLNAIGGLMSSMGLLGGGAQGSQQEINSAVSTARSAVETALSTAYGGTPSDYSAQANAMFPPNITPAQVSAGMQQFQKQMAFRTQAYSSPGTTPVTTNVGANAQSNPPGWF